MTTPPLDLPALRAKLRITKVTDNAEVLALLDRLKAAERDLAAVTVSRDGWQTRAEAAEKKVAAVMEAVGKYHQSGSHVCGDWDTSCGPCVSDEVIDALDHHAPETETTP